METGKNLHEETFDTEWTTQDRLLPSNSIDTHVTNGMEETIEHVIIMWGTSIGVDDVIGVAAG